MAANTNDTRHDYCLFLFQRCRKNITSQQDFFYSNCARELFQLCGDNKSSSSESHGHENNGELHIALVVIYLLIANFSLFSNVFVCLVFYFSKEIRHGKNYFIANLAVADIFIAVLAIPFFLTKFIDKTRITLCQVGSVIDVLCCTSSIIDLAVISVERFISIRYPLRYKTIVSSRRCIWIIAFVWLYSLAFSLLSYVPLGNFYPKFCVFFTNSYIITVAVTNFLLPLLVMLVVYGWIFKVAKYHTRTINRRIPSGVTRTVKNEFKTAKTLTLIIGVYIICWFPFFAYNCMPIVFGYHNPSLALFHSVQIVRYLNSLANPFIYVGINKEFRIKAFKLLKKWTCLRNNMGSSSSQNRHPASVTCDTVLQTTSL